MNISDLRMGSQVTCCGGEPATVLAVSEEQVLLLRHKANQIVYGHFPEFYNGDVVWSWGHYLFLVQPNGEDSVAEALIAAAGLWEHDNLCEHD